ncbi:hypothetical protein NADFUDRAFT_44698 [Nadsonia fulvescens var. elongata DSM 6958]|uniref:Ima1 N-terminal domain-containing protein n=1 Tax=Nadsonia fulvescens var. elongata DSM 6958 TaxID=857566 RepID=A0A1E3PRU7_9ASCO|nr:hypothetical protein NADFUDRAFT_44698 [Nadsonia fulvescens var. elongata DSM 6958]
MVKRNCFFCNKISQVVVESDVAQGQIRWVCPLCDSLNVVDQQGEIVDYIPDYNEQQPVYSSAVIRGSRSSSPPVASSASGFCATCQANHQTVATQISNYLPAGDERSVEYKHKLEHLNNYRSQLEEMYPPVCDNCLPMVMGTIERNNYHAKTRTLGSWLKNQNHNLNHKNSNYSGINIINSGNRGISSRISSRSPTIGLRAGLNTTATSIGNASTISDPHCQSRMMTLSSRERGIKYRTAKWCQLICRIIELTFLGWLIYGAVVPDLQLAYLETVAPAPPILFPSFTYTVVLNIVKSYIKEYFVPNFVHMVLKYGLIVYSAITFAVPITWRFLRRRLVYPIGAIGNPKTRLVLKLILMAYWYFGVVCLLPRLYRHNGLTTKGLSALNILLALVSLGWLVVIRVVVYVNHRPLISLKETKNPLVFYPLRTTKIGETERDNENSQINDSVREQKDDRMQVAIEQVLEPGIYEMKL